MKELIVENKRIGENNTIFIVAEMSSNHLGNFDRAVKIIQAAAFAGADAIKLQTYTPDTITINSDKKYFQINCGSIWDGRTLYDLYKEAYTPWEWQPKLKKIAEEEGLICFSTPFDKGAVDFLERELNPPLYKIASYEITDIPLIEYIAEKRKPVILSSGIAKLSDLELALDTIKYMGNKKIGILKCVSSYPSDIEEYNLETISNLAETFDVIAGLSDHTIGTTVPVLAVAYGAKIIEKHFTLDRASGGPDALFSLEPTEFAHMVKAIREAEKAVGKITYELTEKQKKGRELGRSLFAVVDIKAGNKFTEENIKSVRPAYGLHPKYYKHILGKKAKRDIEKGEPLRWELVNNDE
jgi:pseudaminic acid synthase